MTRRRAASVAGTLLALIVSAALGFQAGRFSRPPAPRAATDSKVNSVRTPLARDPGTASPSGQTPVAVESLAAGDQNSVAALSTLIDRTARERGAHAREVALEAALGRLVALDPRVALAQAQQLDGASRRREVPLVIGAWAERDLDAATEAAFVLEPASLRHDAALEMLRRRADLSPAERRSLATRLSEPEAVEWLLLEAQAKVGPDDAGPALAEAVGMSGQPRRHERLEQIARRVALDAPAAAMSLGDRIPDVRDRTAWQRAVAKSWAEADPQVASAWLDGQPSGIRQRLSDAVAIAYARRDPQAALAWARRASSAGDAGAFNAVLATIAETDPVTAVETALAAPPGPQRPNAIAITIAFLARKDPGLAATYLDRVPAGRDREEATVQIALQMARQDDRAAALDWLAAHAQGRVDTGGRMRIAYDWAAEDPDGALRYADRLPAAERARWTSVVMSAVSQSDPEQALTLLASRRGDEGYAAMVLSTVQGIAQQRPEIAVDLAEQIAEPKQRDRALEAAIRTFAGRSPEDAARMTDRIEDSQTRNGLTQMIVQIWSQSDPRGALDWIRQLPPGNGRDRSYAALVPNMSSVREMETALGRIGSPDIRSQTVYASALALSQRGDADAARDLLFRHPLDPRMMQALEAQLQEGAPLRR